MYTYILSGFGVHDIELRIGMEGVDPKRCMIANKARLHLHQQGTCMADGQQRWGAALRRAADADK